MQRTEEGKKLRLPINPHDQSSKERNKKELETDEPRTIIPSKEIGKTIPGETKTNEEEQNYRSIHENE